MCPLRRSKVKESPEVHALAKLSHQNIMRYYGSTKVFEGHHILVTEWISRCEELGDFVGVVCTKIEAAADEHRIQKVLDKLAMLVRQLADALSYRSQAAVQTPLRRP